MTPPKPHPPINDNGPDDRAPAAGDPGDADAVEGEGEDKAPSAYRTISEVSILLEVPQHVLRFWETKFAPLRPMKRGGGRRYYRPEDVALLRGIRVLLYNDGYTIRGVQKLLREQGPRFVMDYRHRLEEVEEEGAEPHAIPDIAAEAAQSRTSGRSHDIGVSVGRPDSDTLGQLLDEIEACRAILNAAKQ
jgi:DNA-binding transcriptional MerR regulator